jgi:hypothetical protein
MKNLLMLVLVTLAVGCGGTAMEQEEVQTASSVGILYLRRFEVNMPGYTRAHPD